MQEVNRIRGKLEEQLNDVKKLQEVYIIFIHRNIVQIMNY